MPRWRSSRWPVALLWVLALWFVFGAISTLQYYLLALDTAQQITFRASLVGGMLPWLVYAAATPLIFAASRRWPLDQSPRLGHLARHLSAMAAIGLAHQMAWISCMLMANDAFSLDYLVTKWPTLAPRLLNTEILAYWGTLGLAHAMRYRERLHDSALAQAQLHARLAQAQLDALKMQLHPHFLFNTLNAIAVLVKKQETVAATRMIGGLADLLRMALRNQGAQTVPLDEELAFVDSYLEIERVRFGPRLRVRRNVAPEALSALVPNLILQPLVENAIKHGLEPKPEGGCLELVAVREGDGLRIEVRDDGAGLGAGSAAGSGIGLANVRERLERLYGPARARMRILPETTGVCVVLELPWQEA